MRLSAFRVFVDDMAAARGFYEGVLGWPVAFGDVGSGYLGFDVGGTVIVENGAGGGEGLIGRFTGLSLWVDDIDASYADLSSKGVSFTGPPVEEPWGGRLAHFQDPSGNTLTLVSDATVDTE